MRAFNRSRQTLDEADDEDEAAFEKDPSEGVRAVVDA
jgi:hypothetical protein